MHFRSFVYISFMTNMQKFTKIVATISDKRCDVDFIKALAEAGVNVVRMNSAHLEYDGFKKIVENVRAADDSLAIMMDTKGPEVRTTSTASGEPVHFKTGDVVMVSGNPDGLTTAEHIYLNYKDIAKNVRPGNLMLIDDGEMEFRITAVNGDLIEASTCRAYGSTCPLLPSATVETLVMPLNWASISSLTLLSVRPTMSGPCRKSSTSSTCPPKSYQKSKIRKAWTTSTASWRLPTA